MPKLHLYYSTEDESLVEKLKAILKREGSSLSEWFRKRARVYVPMHDPGNPQLRIDNICGIEGKAICSLSSCHEDAVYVICSGNKHTLRCERHKLAQIPYREWTVLDLEEYKKTVGWV